MIIDCHGHYTTAPAELHTFRDAQLAALKSPLAAAVEMGRISEEQIRDSLEKAQLKLQRERGSDLTIFSPRASAMGHHLGNEATSLQWARLCNDLIHRACQLYPDNFAGPCQLPQSPGVAPAHSAAELERCVRELGFVGCNLNPDPSGGYWTSPPLSDPYWYPIYEKLIELDVPAMVHVSHACNPAFHTPGSHYLNGDTTAFMQFLTSDIFTRFPKLKIIIPHGGGAVPYHWGRFRGLAQALKLPLLKDHLLNNIYFDTCVYHLPGQELLAKVIPIDNILFASEMIGAVPGIDPETGYNFDDTKRYIDQLPLSAPDKSKVFEGNAKRVFSRLVRQLEIQAGKKAMGKGQ